MFFHNVLMFKNMMTCTASPSLYTPGADEVCQGFDIVGSSSGWWT
jgi:hypothetical protein